MPIVLIFSGISLYWGTRLVYDALATMIRHGCGHEGALGDPGPNLAGGSAMMLVMFLAIGLLLYLVFLTLRGWGYEDDV